MRRFLFLSMVFLLSVSLSAQKGAKKAAPATADQRLVGIDTLVNRLLKEWHAPGVRDLTCHRTGLPRHDLSWYLNPTTRDSSVMRIQYMEPSAPWRQAWQYNNWMFLLQG
ncbi:MAG: serine hydrolase [Haliscomenobacter sp.]|nr:serine hydrolase [Haliscomenobacter sp.]